MGYQALLFCPDEKLARVVSQVFTELDFTVETVQEPFAAVKKLMAQRFDAIVVDCENEQNASLLFKSSRNSGSNQSSLAIAVVEGQAGVAKAYRIGANLVLTKPINVEQAKGTLRVARGLLRKNSDAAGAAVAPAAATSVKTLPAETPATVSEISHDVTENNALENISTFEAPSKPTPAEIPVSMAAASAKIDDKKIEDKKTEDKSTAIPAAATAMQTEIAAASEHAAEVPKPAFSSASNRDSHSDIVRNSDTIGHSAKGDTAADLFVAPLSAQSTTPAATSFGGSAAAPAPAKEATAAPAKQANAIERDTVSGSLPAATFGASSLSGAPSFGALNEDDSDAAASKKKIMIGVGAVAALLIVAYFGYGIFAKSGTSSPASAPQSVSQSTGSQSMASQQNPAAPSAPSTHSASPSAPATTMASNSASNAGTQTSATRGVIALQPEKSSASAGNPPVIRIDASPEPPAKKPSSAPMQVKTAGNQSKSGTQDDSAPALPLTAAAANDNGLKSIMAADSTVAKPTLATVRISQGVSQGLLIKRVQPKYPSAALAVHAQGAVQIEATINKEGTVTNVKVLSGDPVLARAALEAVRQWRYKPYYLDGDPVEIQTQITVNFKAN